VVFITSLLGPRWGGPGGPPVTGLSGDRGERWVARVRARCRVR